MSNFVVQPEPADGLASPRDRVAAQAGPAEPPAPSHDDIARRAYEVYEKNGRQQGQCQQNWRRAERELRRSIR